MQTAYGQTTASATEAETIALTEEKNGSTLPCRSALLMDTKTGQVLLEQNADEPLPPASVTRIMTLLLVMEAIDGGKLSLDDTVTVSAKAAAMGGSQVYLKEGESMTVEEMLKCVIIASANDCADYVLTLFSDFTRKVTMQNLYHDGGFSSMGMSRNIMETFIKGLNSEK